MYSILEFGIKCDIISLGFSEVNFMKSKSLLGAVLLLVCAFLWGSTFVAQSETSVGPFTYLAMRSIVAVIFLVPVSVISDLIRKKRTPADTYNKSSNKNGIKILLIGGGACGTALFVASALQQIGIDKGTSAGKAGFITALYILVVPLMGLFLKKKVRPLLWVCILVATIGLFLLCLTGDLQEFSLKALCSRDFLTGLSFESCDLYILACAFMFSVQILAVDRYSPHTDPIKLSLAQFSVTSVLSFIAMLIFEQPSVADITASWFSIVYAGVLSSGVAYTLQIFGQKYTQPTVASMLMSLESAFAVLSAIVFSIFISGAPEYPTAYEWIGSGLMFVSIIISQIPEKNKSINKNI